MVAAALQTVFVHSNPNEISAAWDRAADTFARQFPKVKGLMDSATTHELLRVTDLPAVRTVAIESL